MHRTTTMHRAPALVSLVALAACTASARDSASRLATWSVSSTPTLHIGIGVALAGSGASPMEFAHIAGVARMPTGEIVVADGASRELRVFDAEGRFVRALSRKGGGPGEFNFLTRMARARDTLVAFDGFAGIVSRFTLGAGFIDRVTYSGGQASLAASYNVWARLASGALLVSPGMYQVIHPTVNEVERDSSRLGLLHVGASRDVTWLGTFASASYFGYKAPRVRDGVAPGAYIFGPQLAARASGNVVWIGDSGERDIALYDASGERVGTATWPEGPRPFDTDVLAAVKHRELATATERQRRRLDALYDPALRPDHAPYFTSFTAGPRGEMWVERFREDPESPATFIVFDSTGTPLAEVAMPTAIDLDEAGEDYLLGIVKDADGVETVAEYGLRRGEKE